MSENITMKANGAVVYWSPAEATHLGELNLGLENLGMGTCKAQARTSFACLKDAIEEDYKGRDFLVECLQAKLDSFGFEVVKIERGDEKNLYNRVRSFTMNNNAALTVTPHDHDVAVRVVSNFNRQLGLVGASQVTNTLVKVVEVLGGTRLRPKGGMYWLPDNKLDDWRLVAKVAQQAVAKGTSSLYTLRIMHDEDAVRAVRDAITAEIEEQARTIINEIQTGELGTRALEHRKEMAIDLRKKIALYEDLLETGLSTLVDLADRAECAAAEASLTLAAGAE